MSDDRVPLNRWSNLQELSLIGLGAITMNEFYENGRVVFYMLL